MRFTLNQVPAASVHAPDEDRTGLLSSARCLYISLRQYSSLVQGQSITYEYYGAKGG